VYTLFNDESALFARITGLREQLGAAGKGRAPADPLQQRLVDLDGKLDALRKRIVATTEGGAITGEERLREHTDQLYGAIISWDGPPARYQLDNIAALRGELADISAHFDELTRTQLPTLNKSLTGSGAPALEVPPSSASQGADGSGSGGGKPGSRVDVEDGTPLELPKDLRIWH
jgi:hypothetical protein